MPVEPAGAVLEHHAVAVREGAIESLLPSEEAFRAFPDYERLDLPEHLLIPGLVDAHTRAAMSLLRGIANPPPLARFLSERFVRDGTALACAEMLRGGITCFNDMFFFPGAALEAALEAGMRVALGLIVLDEPTPYASDRDDYLRKGLELRDRSREQPLASFCLAAHAPCTVSEATLRQVATLAAELDLPVQVLVSAKGEVGRLDGLGLLGPGLIAVHAVHVNEPEIALLARHGCSVVHCPSSNLKLANGVAPVHSMLKRNVNLALGTDGAAGGNRPDVLTEMRTASLLAKAVSRDAETFPAHSALRAATLGGARALGLCARIGSIEPGKRADLVALALAPCHDPVSDLVYAAGREHVTHVWVDGELRVRDARLENPPSGLDTRWRIWQNAFAAS